MDLMKAFEFCGAVFMYCLAGLIVLASVLAAITVITYSVEAFSDEWRKIKNDYE